VILSGIAGITSDTTLVGLLRWPGRRSLSPAMHNAAFAAAGLDWTYVAFDVAPGSAPAALDAMRTLGIAGLSVTMPHKEAAAAAVDVLDVAATALRSVNTVTRDGEGRLVGHSTDGDGFVDWLAACGVGVAGTDVAVAGAGGAARSVVDALGRAGAAEIAVVNRTAVRADEAARLAATGRVGTPDDIGAADLVVNATSVGMGTDELPFDPATLRPGQVVADLVYHPLDTALLRAARAVGCTTVDGLGMLVHQAVRQQVLWTGIRPDPAVMRAAAESELARRH
jgi:shikimate dehydrogenase